MVRHVHYGDPRHWAPGTDIYGQARLNLDPPCPDRAGSFDDPVDALGASKLFVGLFALHAHSRCLGICRGCAGASPSCETIPADATGPRRTHGRGRAGGVVAGSQRGDHEWRQAVGRT